MSHQPMTFRLPSELVEMIEARAIAEGTTKTAVVSAALRQGSQRSTPQLLQQQLCQIEDQVALLSQQLAEFQVLSRDYYIRDSLTRIKQTVSLLIRSLDDAKVSQQTTTTEKIL